MPDAVVLQKVLLTGGGVILSVNIFLCLMRAVLGPRFTDRIISADITVVNAILLMSVLVKVTGRQGEGSMIQIIIAGALMMAGLFTLCVSLLGIFRFSAMMNRIHAATQSQSLGAVLLLAGLMVLDGWSMFSMKLLLVIIFLWLCSPSASHIAARLEVRTNHNLDSICDSLDLTKGENINDNH